MSYDHVSAFRVEFEKFSKSVLHVLKSQNELLEKLQLQNKNLSSNLLQILANQNAQIEKLGNNFQKPQQSSSTQDQEDSKMSKSGSVARAQLEKLTNIRPVRFEVVECTTSILHQYTIPRYVNYYESYSRNFEPYKQPHPVENVAAVFLLDQLGEKITLQMSWTWNRDASSLSEFKAYVSAQSISGTGSVESRREYLFDLTFIKIQSSGQDVHKWFRIARKKGTSGLVSVPTGSGHSNFTEYFLSRYGTQQLVGVEQTTILVKVIATHAVNDSCSGINPQQRASTTGERMAKLFNLRGQLNSEEVVFKSGEECGRTVAIYSAILRDFSPIFERMLDGTVKSLCIPCMSDESLKLFYDWICGVDNGVWLNSVQINLELLIFAHEYMILELMQLCTSNLIRTPDENYIMESVKEVGKFAESYGIQCLQERIFEWIKTKTVGVCSDGCLPWVSTDEAKKTESEAVTI